MHPSISVLMPIYQGEEYLREAIDSILNQSFSDFELLIINDASKDNSEEIILSYDDERIKYVKNPLNLGLIGTLNVGIEIAKGKYIARMDQDDISVLNRFQLQYDFMEANRDYILVGTQAKIINSRHILDNPISDAAIRAKLNFGTVFIHPTVMIRREMLVKYNLRYQEKYKHAEDYGFWVDLASYGKMANLPQTGLYYRKHDAQYTNMYNIPMFQMVKEIRMQYLKKLGISIHEKDLRLFEILLEKRIDYSNDKLIKEMGSFLYYFSNYFKDSEIDIKEIKKITYKYWGRICDERQKAGFRVYKIFISSLLSYYKFNLISHLYYIKNDYKITRISKKIFKIR